MKYTTNYYLPTKIFYTRKYVNTIWYWQFHLVCDKLPTSSLFFNFFKLSLLLIFIFDWQTNYIISEGEIIFFTTLLLFSSHVHSTWFKLATFIRRGNSDELHKLKEMAEAHSRSVNKELEYLIKMAIRKYNQEKGNEAKRKKRQVNYLARLLIFL